MIEKALVSGQIAQAIFQDDEQLFIINADNIDKVLDCTPYEESLFFNCEAEIKIFENITIEELKDKLLKEKRYFDALCGAIGGFDKNLSKGTRILSIQQAENLVKNPEVSDFVKSRLFGNPVPKEADLEKAIQLCTEENIRDMKFIYTYLLKFEDVIYRILHIFRETTFELKLQSEYVKIKNLFVSEGLFAKLFVNILDENPKNLRNLALKYKDNNELKGKTSAISIILTLMVSRLEEEYNLNIPGLDMLDSKVKLSGTRVDVGEIGSVWYVTGKPKFWFVRDKKEPYNKKKKQ